MKLSPHFTLAEMTRSQTASRKGIDNTPPDHVIENLKRLCVNVLEPLRAAAGRPLHISSGYRSPALNLVVGGARTGSHPLGEAADFECPGLDNLALAHLLRGLVDVEVDQVILEFYVEGQPSSGWLHVSHREKNNRGEFLTAFAEPGGRTRYARGLPQLPQN